MSVSVKGLQRLQRGLSDLAKKHVRFAAAKALTQVAENARMDTVIQMKQLHAPTAWTLSSMYKSPATKARLLAKVFLKDGGGNRRYQAGSREVVAEGQNKLGAIGHLFTGGSREFKRFEKAMQRSGIMPRGMVAVPGSGCPLDAHGNIPRGFIVQMLSYFSSLRETKDWMGEKGRAKFDKRQGRRGAGIGGGGVSYFVSRGSGNWFGRGAWREGKAQHLPPGIWMRAEAFGGSSLKPVIMFVRAPTGYRRYFDLEAIGKKAMLRDFDKQFKADLAAAIRSDGQMAVGASRADRVADYRSRSR